MRKMKIYLDTSVISHLYQQDAPDKMKDTLSLWDAIKRGEYEVYMSQVTLDEVYQCKPEKLNVLQKHLSEIEFSLFEIDDELKQLAMNFIENGILTEKSRNDCYHIAFAMKYDCDAIVSWNFKHINNIKTIRGVKVVSGITGYPEVTIYSPTILVEGGERDG